MLIRLDHNSFTSITCVTRWATLTDRSKPWCTSLRIKASLVPEMESIVFRTQIWMHTWRSKINCTSNKNTYSNLNYQSYRHFRIHNTALLRKIYWMLQIKERYWRNPLIHQDRGLCWLEMEAALRVGSFNLNSNQTRLSRRVVRLQVEKQSSVPVRERAMIYVWTITLTVQRLISQSL